VGNRDLEISTRTKREESKSWKKQKTITRGAEIEKKGGGNGDLEISKRTKTEVSNSSKKKKKRKK
jgi:hypothetical protein